MLKLVALTFLVVPPAGEVAQQQSEELDPAHARKMQQGTKLFRERVRPVFTRHCVECHTGSSAKGDFDLSTRAKLLESGFVEAGEADSHLLAVLRHEAEPHMPLREDRLSDDVIRDISKWVALGAPYDRPLAADSESAGTTVITAANRRFWSFQPLDDQSPPDVPADAELTTVDRFIRAKLLEHGLHPNPPAGRRTLIRRAAFDLTGLPPTPDEIQAFLQDDSPRAWERLVNRLLESPHHGERWARHWMDVARFAESFGFEHDNDRPHAYHYRDFLIQAFNTDLPFDDFVRWQLAGDELAPDNSLALLATGFMGAGVFPTQLTEAEFESSRYDELDDMVTTTGVAFLGLSVGCARCHDHKFDPIPSQDYYRLASAFTKTVRSEIELEVRGEKKTVQVSSEGWPHIKNHADGRGYPHFYPETHFLNRGDVHQKRGVATTGFLQVLQRNGRDATAWVSAPPTGWTRTGHQRAALARWITDVEHGAGHLVARVIVNRLWQHHFGEGLVATPNDFGLQGAPPTHPRLLDWLARDLIAHDWSLRHLHRRIMNTDVYRQSSSRDAARAARDPENRWHWRRVPRRLEGEAIRDSLLAVSGLLDRTLYGPGTLDENMTRRSVYFTIKRSRLIPSLLLFDWPEHLVSIGRRARTTTAPQALLFMNSPLARRSAEAFARRVSDSAEKDNDLQFIDRAWRLAFGRPPGTDERERAAAFLKQLTQQRQSDGSPDRHQVLSDFCQTLLSMNEFIYVD